MASTPDVVIIDAPNKPSVQPACHYGLLRAVNWTEIHDGNLTTITPLPVNRLPTCPPSLDPSLTSRSSSSPVPSSTDTDDSFYHHCYSPVSPVYSSTSNSSSQLPTTPSVVELCLDSDSDQSETEIRMIKQRRWWQTKLRQYRADKQALRKQYRSLFKAGGVLQNSNR